MIIKDCAEMISEGLLMIVHDYGKHPHILSEKVY